MIAGDFIPPIARLQAVVAAHFGVPLRVLTNREMSREAIRARQVGMFLTHELLGKGPSEIGRRFKRDHSTVGHALRKVGGNPSMLRDAAELLEKVEREAGWK